VPGSAGAPAEVMNAHRLTAEALRAAEDRGTGTLLADFGAIHNEVHRRVFEGNRCARDPVGDVPPLPVNVYMADQRRRLIKSGICAEFGFSTSGSVCLQSQYITFHEV